MLANAAFAGLGWGATSKSGGGVLSGVASLLGFANGTPSAPGGLAMVGERGPELVNLPRGSQVITAENTRQMMSGGGASSTTVDVGVSVSDDGQLQAYVTNIATKQAQSAAQASTRASFAAQRASKKFTRS
jgi:phage-related tail protein